MKTSLQNGSCGASTQQSTLQIDTRWSDQGTSSANHVSAAPTQLEEYFRNAAGCGRTLMFARSVDNVVGAFAGGNLTKSTVADLIGKQIESISTVSGQNLPATYVLQASYPSSPNGSASQTPLDTRFSLFADLTSNLSLVQTFLSEYTTNVGEGVDIRHMEGGGNSVHTSVTILGSTVSSNASISDHPIEARALCRDSQVVEKDSCGALVTRCGISGADFTKFNSKTANLCSTLKPKQYVCCSAGELPDHTPQPSLDGICASYQVQPNDGCTSIADSFGINVTRIFDVDKRNWGFREAAQACCKKTKLSASARVIRLYQPRILQSYAVHRWSAHRDLLLGITSRKSIRVF